MKYFFLRFFASFLCSLGIVKSFELVGCPDSSWILSRGENGKEFCWKHFTQTTISFTNSVKVCLTFGRPNREIGFVSFTKYIDVDTDVEKIWLGSYLEHEENKCESLIKMKATTENGIISTTAASNWDSESTTVETTQEILTTETTPTFEAQDIEYFWKQSNSPSGCEEKLTFICQSSPSLVPEKVEQSTATLYKNSEQANVQIQTLLKKLEETQQKMDLAYTDFKNAAASLFQTDHVIKVNVEKLERDLNTNVQSLNSQIAAVKAKPIFPSGFIYVQFPSKSSPSQLWPSLTWKDVTSNYAGLFFRAEGGGSSSFGGGIQTENAPKITGIREDGSCSTSSISLDYNYGYSSCLRTDWHSMTSGRTNSILFYMKGGEVRPKNVAIRIWLLV